MISWLRTTLRQAALPPMVLAALGVAALVIGAVIQDLFGVFLLSVAVCLGVLGIGLETLAARGRARTARIREEWPSVLESLESAALAGMTLLDSMRDLAESTQLMAAKDFAFACDACDGGETLDASLVQLKARFALAECDLTIETMRMLNDSGGAGFISAMQLQAAAIRERGQLVQQVEAKQGWVAGTAKVAVAAPWIIVAMLSMRPENAAVYNTASGELLLAFGMLASFVALRLIAIIGRLQQSNRTFA